MKIKNRIITFGNIAPAFNVEVTETYLFEMFYTLDGELQNYSFTENGMIDQSAWDSLPERNLIITFYAIDMVGNKALK